MLQDIILSSVLLGIGAWVITGPLMRAGMLLEGWARMLDRLNQHGHGWLAKPLGWCGKCFAGQLGLWYSITTQPFYFWHAALTATTSIFFFIIIQKWQSYSND